MTWPSVTVTIAQWGKVDYTERCVAALLESEYEAGLEILVYDNASPGGPGAVAEMEGVDLTRGETNIGFGPAHNLLADRAKGDYLLVLNNDTIVTPSALTKMADALSAEAVGAVTPRYVGFDGTTLEMGGYVGADGEGWQLFRGSRPPQYMTRAPFVADYGSAACLLTPRDLFLGLGGFDDRYAPAYYEDTDYCFRLSSAGQRTVVEPRAVVYHFEGATAGKDISSGMKQLQEEHRTIFSKRWEDDVAGRPPITADQALIRALGLEGRAVLWISPELPRPDHEAGHARMVSMMRALREDGAAVVLWAEMAPEWERYGVVLEEAGIPWFGFRLSGRLHGENRAEYSTIQALLGLDCWNTVIVSFPEMAERMIPVIREVSPRTPVLVDAVDLHFLREGRDPSISIDGAEEAREAELDIYRSADGVITAADHEADVLEQLLPEVSAAVFSSVSTLSLHPESLSSVDGPPIFLGNLNHPPNLAAVDRWAEDVFPRLSESARRPLVLFGSAVERFADRWPAEVVDVRGWVPDLKAAFTAARCFVAPITFGAGTKGKMLEAAAAGVPVVTTTIGAEGYRGALRDSMLVADDVDEFAGVVETILTDDEAWRAARDSSLAGAAEWETRASVEQSEWAAWVGRRKRLTPDHIVEADLGGPR